MNLFLLASAFPTVFGITLGEPLSIPECPFEKTSQPSSVRLYTPGPQEICYQDVFGSISVQMPLTQMPTLMSMNSLFVAVKEGKVEKISAPLLGHSVRNDIMTALTEKFGKPVSVQAETVSPHGIPLTETVARWTGTGFEASYESIAGDLDHGMLVVKTTDRAQRDATAEQVANAKRISL